MRDIALLACLLATNASTWAATAASGTAYGLAVSAQLAPLLLGPTASVTLSPIPSVTGNAPPDYAVPGSAASATAGVTGLPTLVSTGALNTNTTATLATDISQSTASVDNLNVSVAGLIGLSAATVSSSASVTCSAGALVPSGGTTLTGAALTLLGLPVGVLASPAPNTGISALGISIMLNEQVVTASSITVNAIHISINNALLALVGNLTADIVVGHASATLTSTCPPATAPDLALSISQPVPALVAGQTSQITVTLSNVGTAVAPGPQAVTVQLPGGVSAPASFANGGWTCTNAAGTMTCTNPAPVAAAGASAFTIDVTPSAAAVGTTPTITASTPPLPGETNTANNSASMTTTVAVAPAPPGTAPDLALSISQPTPSLVASQPSTITVTLHNVGTAAAVGPQTVVVSLPSEVTAPASFSGTGWSCTNATGTVTCGNPNAVGAGTSSAFAVTITPTSGSVGATPTITATTPPAVGEIDIANNSASMTASVAVAAVPPSPAPDLQLTVSQPAPNLVAGQTSTISVTLANIGNASAPGPQSVTITLPTGIITAGSFGNNGWSCTASANVAGCSNPAAIGVGGNTAFTIAVTPGSQTVGTTPTITASTPAAVGETNLANNQASMTAAVAVSGGGGPGPTPVPDLALMISQPVPALVANVASDVAVTVTNVGSGTAAGPQSVTVTLPSGLSVPASSSTGGWTCAASGATVLCTSPAALSAGASASFVLSTTPSAATVGTTPTLVATTPAAAGEVDLANNTASMTAAVSVGGGSNPNPPVPPSGRPDLLLTIGAPVPSLVVGEISLVPVTLSNVGTASAPGPFTVTISLPPQTLSPPTVDNGTWSCHIADHLATCAAAIGLAAGASSSFAIPVTPDFSAGGNTVTTTGSTPPAPEEANTANNFAAMTATVAGPGGDENYQDLWWNPSESGWGATIMHQGNTLVIAVYDYDANGAPTWQFLANAQRTTGTTYAGAMYRITGTPFDGRPFDASQTNPVVIGHAQIQFTDPYSAVLTMPAGSGTVTKHITRQTFAPLQTLAGQYAAGTKAVSSGCADPARNGTVLATAMATITVSGDAYTIVRTPVGSGPSCTTTGTVRQHGSLMVSLDAVTACSDGVQMAGMSLMRIQNNSLVERTWQTQQQSGACNVVATMTGVK